MRCERHGIAHMRCAGSIRDSGEHWSLFRDSTVITSGVVEMVFGISPRAARNILSAWVRDGFIVEGSGGNGVVVEYPYN
jgi:hypothetical protein